jgi:hypothetical protein
MEKKSNIIRGILPTSGYFSVRNGPFKSYTGFSNYWNCTGLTGPPPAVYRKKIIEFMKEVNDRSGPI